MIFILHVINLPFLTMIRLLTWCYEIITHSHRTILVWKDIFNSDCEQFYQYQQNKKNTYRAWDRHNKYGRVQSVREALVSRYLFQAFFMASVRCASINYEEQQHIARKDQFRPYILPACLCPSLCTSQQAEWWSAMYKFCNGKAKENFPKLRSTLQRGLEVIRLQGTHGLSVVAVANIARTFDQRVCILYTNNYLYLARAMWTFTIMKDSLSTLHPSLLSVFWHFDIHLWNHFGEIKTNWGEIKSCSPFHKNVCYKYLL
jgi:hypothetical protein